jgi:hypothetical protein
MTKTQFADTQRAGYALIAAAAEQDHAAVDAILSSCDLRPVAHELAVLAAGESRHSQQPPAVGLRQAAAQGIIPGLAAARTMRHRDPDGFPRPVWHRGLESLYDPAQLAAYYEARDKR